MRDDTQDDVLPAAVMLPARTVHLLELKGFTMSEDGTTAHYHGKVDITITRQGDELELCFCFPDRSTLYAKPSGVLLVAEDNSKENEKESERDE